MATTAPTHNVYRIPRENDRSHRHEPGSLGRTLQRVGALEIVMLLVGVVLVSL